MDEAIKLQLMTEPLPYLELRLFDHQVIVLCAQRKHAEEWREVLRPLGRVQTLMRITPPVKGKGARKITYRIGAKL